MSQIAHLSNYVKMINFSRMLENVPEIDFHLREIVKNPIKHFHNL